MTSALVPFTVQTERVRLEPLGEAHLDALALLVNEEVWRYNAFAHLTPERRAAWARLREDEAARGTGTALAIVGARDGAVLGSTSLYDFDAPHRRAEIGRTFLVPAAWRSFANTDAKFLLLAHAFETLGLHRVQLKTDARNLRSQAAIERLGAVREGVLRAHMVLPDGFVRDSVMYSVTRPDWPEVRARLDVLRR